MLHFILTALGHPTSCHPSPFSSPDPLTAQSTPCPWPCPPDTPALRTPPPRLPPDTFLVPPSFLPPSPPSPHDPPLLALCPVQQAAPQVCHAQAHSPQQGGGDGELHVGVVQRHNVLRWGNKGGDGRRAWGERRSCLQRPLRLQGVPRKLVGPCRGSGATAPKHPCQTQTSHACSEHLAYSLPSARTFTFLLCICTCCKHPASSPLPCSPPR